MPRSVTAQQFHNSRGHIPVELIVARTYRQVVAVHEPLNFKERFTCGDT